MATRTNTTKDQRLNANRKVAKNAKVRKEGQKFSVGRKNEFRMGTDYPQQFRRTLRVKRKPLGEFPDLARVQFPLARKDFGHHLLGTDFGQIALPQLMLL